jgi:hypothetical protein
MGKKVITVTAVLVGLYIASAYATGFGKSLQTAGGVYTGAVKALQGR